MRAWVFGVLLVVACGGDRRPEAASPLPGPDASAPSVPSATASTRPEVPKDLPLVAIVRADWCPACRATEPKLAVIEHDYAGRVAFLRLDVTDDDTTAGAALDADAAGVRAFFDQSKGRTATIGVFSKDRREVFRTWGLKNETELRAALDAAAPRP
jgi:thiol-disulfide isomerase/thioredoxin